jgi:hypothetical protein
MSIKVLCFGNEFLPFDSLAKELADKLDIEGFEFVKCDIPEEILSYSGEELLLILDVVKGIKKVILIKDLAQLKASAITTAHDFDLNFFLNLMTNFGNDLSNVRIIGLPMGSSVEDVSEDVAKLLKNLKK